MWGSLERKQAQAGLRRELYRLRRLTENLEVPLLHSDFRAIRLNLSFVDVDIRQVGGITANAGEFLEGIDIPGEDAFEDWLRETRRSEEHTSELQSLMRISYAVFCLKKNKLDRTVYN